MYELVSEYVPMGDPEEVGEERTANIPADRSDPPAEAANDPMWWPVEEPREKRLILGTDVFEQECYGLSNPAAKAVLGLLPALALCILRGLPFLIPPLKPEHAERAQLVERPLAKQGAALDPNAAQWHQAGSRRRLQGLLVGHESDAKLVLEPLDSAPAGPDEEADVLVWNVKEEATPLEEEASGAASIDTTHVVVLFAQSARRGL